MDKKKKEEKENNPLELTDSSATTDAPTSTEKAEKKGKKKKNDNKSNRITASKSYSTNLEKILAGSILFCILITIIGGWNAGIAVKEILYRCFIITLILTVLSYFIRKYSILVENFKNIFEELDKDTIRRKGIK